MTHIIDLRILSFLMDWFQFSSSLSQDGTERKDFLWDFNQRFQRAVGFWLAYAIFPALAIQTYAATNPAVIEAAKKEGELALWTASDLQQVTRMGQQFEKNTPFSKSTYTAAAPRRFKAANEPVPGRGHSFRVQQIAAGEYFLTLAYANPIQAAKFHGAPVDWVVLEPAAVSLNAIMLEAPHERTYTLSVLVEGFGITTYANCHSERKTRNLS